MTMENNESGWQMYPLEGETGMAYMGIKDEEKVFLKKNASPFLAALSIQGITPRLKWTKRLGNGDVLSAQEWLNGRCLEPKEMGSERVIQLIKTIQSSEALFRMLKSVGGQVAYPDELLGELKENLCEDLRGDPLVRDVLDWLARHIIQPAEEELAVCHGDMNHKNWMLSDKDNIYLVDWDNAFITDHIYDIASIFYHYIDPSSWDSCLQQYGIRTDAAIKNKIQWYGKYSLLISLNKTFKQGHYGKTEECRSLLNKLP